MPDQSPKPEVKGPPSVWEDIPAPPPKSRIPKPPELAERFKELSPVQILAGTVGIVLLLLIIINELRPVSTPVVPSGTTDRALALSGDGSKLVMGLRSGAIRVFQLQNGRAKPLMSTKLGASVLAVAFGPNDDVIALMAPGAADPAHPEKSETEVSLQIFSADLKTRTQRSLQANAHDVVWSSAANALFVLSGGKDDLHARLEIFPNQPFEITSSTSQLVELKTYFTPRHLSMSPDGQRVAVSFYAPHNANIGVFDWLNAKTLTTHFVPDNPDGITFSSDGEKLAVASPEAEMVTFIQPKTITSVQIPKSSSMSPPQMVVFSPDASRAYTAGAVTLPAIGYDPEGVARKVELPNRSTSILLSPDGHTVYLSYDDSDDLGIFDLVTGAGLAVTWREK